MIYSAQRVESWCNYTFSSTLSLLTLRQGTRGQDIKSREEAPRLELVKKSPLALSTSNYVHLSPTGVLQKQSNDHGRCTFNYRLPAQQLKCTPIMERKFHKKTLFLSCYDILQKVTFRRQRHSVTWKQTFWAIEALHVGLMKTNNYPPAPYAGWASAVSYRGHPLRSCGQKTWSERAASNRAPIWNRIRVVRRFRLRNMYLFFFSGSTAHELGELSDAKD